MTLIGVAPSLQSRLLPCYGVDMPIAPDMDKRYPADWVSGAGPSSSTARPAGVNGAAPSTTNPILTPAALSF